MKITDLLFETNTSTVSAYLQDLVNKDQAERREYANFVKTELNGNFDGAGEKYAQLKNRPADDVFGEKERTLSFIKKAPTFDYDNFSETDWKNFWLLAQHADYDVEFQKYALNIIKSKLGTDSKHYKYLHDRITCNLYGTQKYGTQDICGD